MLNFGAPAVAEVQNPSLRRFTCPVHRTGMAQFDVQIEKMHCGACVRRVAQALNSLPATHADSVAVGAATVTTQAPTAAVLEALQQAGFPAHIVAERS